MHEMQSMASDDLDVCKSVRLHCAKTAKQIEVLFRVKTLGGPKNIVLDRREGEEVGGGIF